MPAPLNNLDLFELLRADLQPFVETTKKGLLSVAHDPFHVLELLGEAPGRFRVILAWDGEENAGQVTTSGIVQHKFRAIVSHNRGLSILKGTNLTVARAGDAPLMQLANEVRDRLRTLTFPEETTSELLEYQGCEPVKVDLGSQTVQLDAYELSFRIHAAITRAVYRSP